MDKAWYILQELGAVDTDDNLTALGRHMVREKNLLGDKSLTISPS